MTQDDQTRQRAIRAQTWVLKLSRNWLKIILFVLGTYVALPFVAPTLMHLGLTGPAQLLYTLYSPMCHQFAFRSWFLFGEQPIYPRADAHTPGVSTFEEFVRSDPTFARVPDLTSWTDDLIVLSKFFVGNEQMGYKVALCERDVAIYGAIFLGGLLFSLVRRRLRPIPLWLYVLIGLGPIGLDGFSQLLSYPPFSLWPARESSWVFRTVTGALFGFANAWLAFPYMERGMRETRDELEHKLRSVGALDAASSQPPAVSGP